MRVGVIGTMEEVNEVDVKAVLYELFIDNEMADDTRTMAVLSGGTKGVDNVAREAAADYGIDFILFKPQFMLDPSREMNIKDFWIRDKQIIDNSDVVVIIGPKEDKRCSRCERHANRRKKEVVRRYL